MPHFFRRVTSYLIYTYLSLIMPSLVTFSHADQALEQGEPDLALGKHRKTGIFGRRARKG